MTSILLKYYKILIVTLTVCICPIDCQAQQDTELSQEEIQWIAEHPVIKSHKENTPPYHFIDDGPSGISIEILEIIAEKYDFRIDYIDKKPNKEALNTSEKQQEIDIVPMAVDTEEHREKMRLSENYAFSPIVIYTSLGESEIINLSDLRGKTVAMSQHVSLINKVKESYPEIKITEFSSQLNGLIALNNKKVDAYIGNMAIGRYLILQNKLDNIKEPIPTHWENQKLAFGVRKDYGILADILNKGLSGIDDKTLTSLFHKYDIVDNKKTISKSSFLIIVIVPLLMILILLWYWKLRKKTTTRAKALVEHQERLKKELEKQSRKISESEQSLLDAQSMAHIGTITVDHCKKTTTWSTETYKLLGLNPEGDHPSFTSFTERIHPDDKQNFDNTVKNALSKGTSYTQEYRIVDTNGKVKNVNQIVKMELDSLGKPVKSTITIQDITATKLQAQKIIDKEKDLVEQNKRLEEANKVANQALDISHSGSWHMDFSSIPDRMYCDDRMKNLIGIEFGEGIDYILLSNFAQLITEADATAAEEFLNDLDTFLNCSSDLIFKGRYKLYNNKFKKGTCLRVTASLERDSQSKPLKLTGVTQDISDLKCKEAEIASINKVLSLAQSVANIGHYEWFPIENKLTASEQYYKIHEATHETLKDIEDVYNMMHPDDIELFKSKVQNSKKKQEPIRVEYRIITNSGIKNVLSLGDLKFNEDGVLIYVLGTTQDVTEQKRQEQKVAESERRLSTALSASNTGLWDINPQTGTTIVNDIWKTMLGYDGKDTIALNSIDDYFSLIHPDDRLQVQKELENTPSETTKIYRNEIRMQCANGTYKWIERAGRVIEYDQYNKPSRMIGIHTDITSKKTQERRILKSEQKLAVTLNSIGDAIIATDKNGLISRMNPVAEKLTGWSFVEAEGKLIDDVFLIVHAVTRAPQLNPVDLVLKTGITQELANHTVVIHKNGSERHIAEAAAPIRNNNNEIIGVILNFRDVSETYESQKRLRLKQKELQSIFDKAPIAMMLVNEDVTIRKINNAATYMTGCQRNDVIGMMCGKLFRCVNDEKGSKGCNKEKECPLCDVRNAIKETYEAKKDIIKRPSKLTILKDNKPFILSLLISTTLLDVDGSETVLLAVDDITVQKLQEQKIRESERLTKQLINSTSEGIFGVNTEGEITFVNSAFKALLGYKKSEIIGKNAHEILHQHQTNGSEHLAQDCPVTLTLTKGIEHQIDDLMLWKKDGSSIDVEFSVMPIVTNNIQSGAVISFKDIRARKQQEKMLVKYQKAIESSGEAIGMTTPDGISNFVNKAFTDMFGYTSEEFTGVAPHQVYVDTEIANDVFGTTMAGKSWSGELEMLKKDGKQFPVHLRADAIKDDNGKIIGLLVVHSDITEQKKQITALRKSEHKAKLALKLSKSAPFYIDFVNHPNRFYTTKEMYKLIGLEWTNKEDRRYRTAEWFTQNILKTNKKLGEKAVNLLQGAIGNPEVEYNTEYQFTRKIDGKVIWLKAVAEIERDTQGNALRMWGVNQDITEQKEKEAERQKLLNQQKLASEQAKLGSWHIDFSKIPTSIVYDENLASIEGYEFIEGENFELLEEWLLDLASRGEAGVEMAKKAKEGLTNPKIFIWDKSYQYTRKNDGRVIWIRAKAIVKRDPSGNPVQVYGSTQDITEQKLAEKEIIATSKSLSEAQRIANIGNYKIDLAKNKFTCSDEIYRIFGYEPGEYIINEKSIEEHVHPDDLTMVLELIAQAIDRLQSFNFVHRIITVNHEERIVNSKGEIEFNEKGDPTIFVGIVNDITPQKVSEKALLEAKLEAEAANIAKSAFLANMSHEIRTPMNSIMGFSEILSKRIKDPVSSDFLESIHSSGKTLLRLINDILDFSKIEAGKFDLKLMPTNLETSVTEITNLFKMKALEKGLTFNTTVAETVPAFVLLDELRVKQVLINLIGNALKFTNQGSISLEIDCNNTSDVLSDISFKVIDTGIGIAKEEHQKVFEAFKQQDQQDNRKFAGTGLGLSISGSLIGMMGSKIEIDSEKGKGSTFHFTLYNLKTANSNEVLEDNYVDIQRVVFENSKILVINNNDKTIKDSLYEKAINTLEAINTEEGIYLAQNEIPQLILVDISESKVQGSEVLKRIKETRSIAQIPCIALTKSANEKELRSLTDEGFNSYITKPIEEAILIKELMKILPYSYKQKVDEEVIIEKVVGFNEILNDNTIVEAIKIECIPLFNAYREHESSKNTKLLANKLIQVGEHSNNAVVTKVGKDILLALDTFNVEKIEQIMTELNALCDCIQEKQS